ncbi:hypothetical protein PV328_000624 [Microctonus aethiopoides]|uniref:Uncharacterized protein n=1 Tax=Microctonus aethiopoides TaxID=144406 RepID=A0AA39FVI4_9HYME|nr:hypothetical protein PV328_000624 [Microctonus aethiopoides]
MKTTYSWYSYAERKRRWDVFGARDEQAQEMRSFPKIREAKIENRISKQIGLPHRLQFHNRKRKYRVPARRDVIIESQKVFLSCYLQKRRAYYALKLHGFYKASGKLS